MEEIKLLYGTGNPAKLNAMKKRLSRVGITLVGLKDLGGEIPEVAEDGKTPLENARKKAVAYFEAFRIPVFSCDSGLYIDGVPENEQPGVHVRRVNGKVLSDEQMIVHYSSLAKKYGNPTARYRNAICFVEDEKLENSLRPMKLEEYIGQERVKSNLKVYIEAARNRKDVLDHVLLYGPPGLGKTTLASIISNEMGTNLKVTSGPAIEKPGEMAAILNNLNEGDVLFVDEIHRLLQAIHNAKENQSELIEKITEELKKFK